MKRIILKPGEEARLLQGHPWVYGNEIARVLAGPGASAVPAALVPGEVADVESSRKTYVGRAFVNPNSKITARMYSSSKEGADKGFFRRRIREAMRRRLLPPCSLVPGRESARAVFGEADFLPGLIVDRFTGWARSAFEAAFSAADSPGGAPSFEDARAALGPPSSWLSVQFLAWGVDARRDDILAVLEEAFVPPAGNGAGNVSTDAANVSAANVSADEIFSAPLGIIEKSAARAREMEGLPPAEGVLRGNFPEGGIVIFENGFPFLVDPSGGQKTGFYLDQRENRRLAARYASGARVLDVCSYTGGFSIYAARAGALQVTSVDVSADALKILAVNAALNGSGGRIIPVEEDLFESLRRMERKKERFDLVILDPPAFAKSRQALEGALRGYREINVRAMKILRPGGVLVSCSCSHALSEERFKKMIAEAAADAGRAAHQLDFRTQSPDHPVRAGYGESYYLKCGFYRMVY
ncbi:MAG: class I SAM-dependent rRNA methyltransferase [Treponema sp.]|jgi:23S rRNA (cytosine1962-C5)-methyltransferase|nr:class I SAM-dependent rRNA methyltransferase [Treponema sp.]